MTSGSGARRSAWATAIPKTNRPPGCGCGCSCWRPEFERAAWLTYLTGAQRLAVGAVGVVALGLGLGGLVVLLLPHDDVLSGLNSPAALHKSLSAAEGAASAPN